MFSLNFSVKKGFDVKIFVYQIPTSLWAAKMERYKAPFACQIQPFALDNAFINLEYIARDRYRRKQLLEILREPLTNVKIKYQV